MQDDEIYDKYIKPEEKASTEKNINTLSAEYLENLKKVLNNGLDRLIINLRTRANRLEPLVMEKIAEERFSFDGTQINGFYAIYDKDNEDNAIWIDCPNNYLPIIVKALNSNFSA